MRHWTDLLLSSRALPAEMRKWTKVSGANGVSCATHWVVVKKHTPTISCSVRPISWQLLLNMQLHCRT
ncbi:hypothetical protein FOPG_19277 [Fusarium oxysporum f. sp. conglutinans race 2 54008]|uniref:Uncharacterized protein n=1 Tax=Fusarium oxysporum f. sp. conglutinans race 2 54008 TaxID=1089457 RepID=X0HTG2_FUSOX|nr:hypothetical protein FOPG_19277 [Fusarium oxysporum f. sp. conglutinans race 2 54008]